MTLETATTIADQIIEWDSSINVIFSGRSEPTLHKQFDKLANVFLERGINLYLITNGAKLNRYVETALEFKRVALDVYSDDRNDFDSVYNEYHTLPFKHLLLEQVTSNGQRIISWDSHYPQEFKKPKPLVLENRAGSLNVVIPSKKKCNRLLWTTVINWNGDYNLCCDDWTPHVLGNIHDQQLKDFWYNNKKLNQYRQALLDKKPLSPCNVCSR